MLLCCTIIGIPFGIVSFRLAGLVLAPLGKDIVKRGQEPVGVAVVVTASFLVVVPLEPQPPKGAWVPAPAGQLGFSRPSRRNATSVQPSRVAGLLDRSWAREPGRAIGPCRASKR